MAAHKRNRSRFRHVQHKRRLKKRKEKFGGLAAFFYDVEPASHKVRAARLGRL